MIIGTVRLEESIAYDSRAGFHRFHAEETQEEYGSFEVFWDDGWYWWSCSPGCLPDAKPTGPFAYSQQAHEDADEWAPEYDDNYED